MVHSRGPITSEGSTPYDKEQLAIALPDKNRTRLSNDGHCRSLPDPNLNSASRSHKFDEIAIERAVHPASDQFRTRLLPVLVPFAIGPDSHGGDWLDQISISSARGPRFSAMKVLRRPPGRTLDLDHGAAETSSLCESLDRIDYRRGSIASALPQLAGIDRSGLQVCSVPTRSRHLAE